MQVFVESTEDFERLICVVEINDQYGLIVSEEVPGTYMVTICSIPVQTEEFFQRKKIASHLLPVQHLREALDAGIARLKEMDLPQQH